MYSMYGLVSRIQKELLKLKSNQKMVIVKERERKEKIPHDATKIPVPQLRPETAKNK